MKTRLIPILFLALSAVIGWSQTPKTRSDLYLQIVADLPSGQRLGMSAFRGVLDDVLASSHNTPTDGTAVVTSGTYANPTWLSEVAWSKLTTTPTTLGGYGITDADTSAETSNAIGVVQTAIDTHAALTNNPHAVTKEQVAGLLSSDSPTFAGLTANSNSDGTQILGRMKVGTAFSDVATLAHFDRFNPTEYALIQRADGTTDINSTGALTFKRYGTEVGSFDVSGNFAVTAGTPATNTTSGALQVPNGGFSAGGSGWFGGGINAAGALSLTGNTSHAIGTPSTSYLLNVNQSFTSTGSALGSVWNPTLTQGTAMSGTSASLVTQGTINKPSGAGTWATGLWAIQPTIGAGAGGSFTNAATVYINGPPTGAMNNYSLYVGSGESHFGGAVTVENTSPRLSLNDTSSATNSRNWELYASYAAEGDLKLRVSSAKDIVPDLDVLSFDPNGTAYTQGTDFIIGPENMANGATSSSAHTLYIAGAGSDGSIGGKLQFGEVGSGEITITRITAEITPIGQTSYARGGLDFKTKGTADNAGPTSRMVINADGTVAVSSNEAATNTSSGALQVPNGGISTGGAGYFGAQVESTSYAISTDSQGTVLSSSANTLYLDSASGDINLRPKNGTNDVRITNGAGLFVTGSITIGPDQVLTRSNSTTLTTNNGLAVGGTLTGNAILSTAATAGIGYGTGAGGSVTQITSRTTGVTINKVSGAITLVSAAGSTSWQALNVTNSAVGINDTVQVTPQIGFTDLHLVEVSKVGNGLFQIIFKTTGGTTTEAPIFNFSVIKGTSS